MSEQYMLLTWRNEGSLYYLKGWLFLLLLAATHKAGSAAAAA